MLHKLHKKLCTESKSRHYDHYVTGTHSLINVAYSLITKHFTHEINFTTRSCLRESGVPGWVPPVRQAQRLQAYKQKKQEYHIKCPPTQAKLNCYQRLKSINIYQSAPPKTIIAIHCSLAKFGPNLQILMMFQLMARIWPSAPLYDVGIILQNSAHLLVSGVCIWDLVLVTFPRGICHNIPTWKPAGLLWWPSQHWAAVQPAIPSYAAWLGTL